LSAADTTRPGEDDRERIALGVQQPWAELILRGVKTVEIRSQGTRQRGPIYLYASKRVSTLPAAAEAAARHGVDVESLPRGLLVGTVEIVGSEPAGAEDAAAACLPVELLTGKFGWQLASPRRLAEPLMPRFLPYGVWFYPFQRRGKNPGERGAT
jgi:hypothetical protein